MIGQGCEQRVWHRGGRAAQIEDDPIGLHVWQPGESAAVMREHQPVPGAGRGERGRQLVDLCPLGEVRRQPMLTREEEITLARRSSRGDQIAAARLVVKYNTVRRPEALASVRDGQFVCLARLSAEKGIDVLLDAWGQAFPDGDGRLLILGTGEREAALRERAATLAGVELPGLIPQPEALGLLAGSRAAIVPSLSYEGFPRVVAEAFALGVPVVASRIGSLPEIVEDGKNGFIVEAGDRAALGARLRWLSTHPQAAAELGAEGRRTVCRRFQWSNVVERCLDDLGDWRVCLLSPLGSRIHAPWAMAVTAQIRSRTGTDVEVMWGDEGFVVRFPDVETPPDPALLLPDPDVAEGLVLRQLGATSLFAARFRETAARALLLPRRRQGINAFEGPVERRRPARYGPVRRAYFGQQVMHADFIRTSRLRLVG